VFIESNPPTVIEPTIEDPVLDLLEFALERVRNGWCQGTMVSDDGEFCTVGAVLCDSTFLFAPDEHDPWANATDDELKALHLVADAAGIATDDLMEWNDAPHREQYQVVRVFERAAEDRRPKGGGE